MLDRRRTNNLIQFVVSSVAITVIMVATPDVSWWMRLIGIVLIWVLASGYYEEPPYQAIMKAKKIQEYKEQENDHQ